MSVYAIDFDGTFTTDPEVFRIFVSALRDRGHTVLMITQRCRKYEAEIEAVVGPLSLFNRIIYASGISKENAALIAGHNVDVWIDDNPYSIHTALTYKGCT